MPDDFSRDKVDAIYEVREAAETKVRAEERLAASGSPAARDALLDAQLDLEAKTQDAIEACHECGEVHASDAEHGTNAGRRDNVIAVDFRRMDA